MARIRVEAFVMCEDVLTDERGRTTLKNIFNQIRSESFPCRQKLVIYARVRLPRPGSWEGEIEIQGPSGAIGRPLSRENMTSRGRELVELAINESAFPFPEAGKYVLSLKVDGTKVTELRIDAVATGSAGASGPVS